MNFNKAKITLTGCIGGLLMLTFSSCKSDSDKMKERSLEHISKISVIKDSKEYDDFLNENPNCLKDFTLAIQGDSIYTDQDLEEAMPYIFDAVYTTLDKQEEVMMADNRNNGTTQQLLLATSMYLLKIPYCTKVSQLQSMGRTLNVLTIPLLTQYNLSPIEMTIIRYSNDLLEKINARKAEIEQGNLYKSKYLK